MHPALSLCAVFVLLVHAASQVVINPKSSPGTAGGVPSLPIDLSSLYNNRAFARGPNDADFDGFGAGYPAEHLPGKNFTYRGIDFLLPEYSPKGGHDNVIAQGQLLKIPEGYYAAVHMLLAADNAMVTDSIRATYIDGVVTNTNITGFPWWSWPSMSAPWQYAGDLVFPRRYTRENTDLNRSAIFHTVSPLDVTDWLTSLRLPNVTTGAAPGSGVGKVDSRLHVFAVSLVPGSDDWGLVLEVQTARSTNSWFEGSKAQIFEAVILNRGDQWILADDAVYVTVEAENARTVKPARIKRLRPGAEARVQIGVVSSVGSGGAVSTTAKIVFHNITLPTYTFDATLGIQDYDSTPASIYSHDAPAWFDNGKYGISIHWGPYSVPAWGGPGPDKSSAEWYWYWMNQGPSSTGEGTREHHLQTYGPNIAYDDFIANFTASAYNPKEWVDLFADAGANYFVLSARHYDGYALFDSPATVSLRTSVAQVPHRNLLQELYEAADKYQPHLRKGAYYSLPEWFHPDYHGFAEWPGGNATHPYTKETLPYLGYVPLKNFVQEKMLTEMRTLASMGTDLLWCDIGGPNPTMDFAAEYFNHARKDRDRQVAINNRCGIEGDFDTATYTALQPNRKWERTASLDPFSYGYSRATPDDAYMKPNEIVKRLVEAISLNGNFLLNIGPDAQGTIPSVQRNAVRTAGAWIKSHAEAIYNTTFWSLTPNSASASANRNANIHFTETLDAFYIFVLEARLNATVSIHAPVPAIPGDEVTIVGGPKAGSMVKSWLDSNGTLRLEVGADVRAVEDLAWVFKIKYECRMTDAIV